MELVVLRGSEGLRERMMPVCPLDQPRTLLRGKQVSCMPPGTGLQMLSVPASEACLVIIRKTRLFLKIGPMSISWCDLVTVYVVLFVAHWKPGRYPLPNSLMRTRKELGGGGEAGGTWCQVKPASLAVFVQPSSQMTEAKAFAGPQTRAQSPVFLFFFVGLFACLFLSCPLLS